MQNICHYQNSAVSCNQSRENNRKKDVNSVCDTSFLEWSICKISLHLTKILQQEEAILLPELYSMFQQHISHI